ncbi:hypothetical protein IEO21_06730 [Rhodonia placenta]|uniref:MICOS complex subunit MIC12 n=1 Tax=Rhodonia placenta TaxID=104341 RepID=A0A8H7NZH8_9APHY|nr:hypothetical protein IEO21_06730 [Postia placenta]
MSFLVGPVSGALAAGGVYYGFSTLIQTRTEQHRSDLHKLSQRLLDAPSNIPAPASAAQRIVRHPFASLLKNQWNTQLETLFQGADGWGRRVSDWTRDKLYGGGAPSTRAN